MLDTPILDTEPAERARTPLQRVAAICPGYLEAAAAARRAERERMSREQIARAQRVGQDSGRVGKKDFGPGIRLERHDVVTEFREDPDPSVGALTRGGRVRDGLHAMWKAGTISKIQWDGVCRLRDDIEIAAGAKPESAGRVAIPIFLITAHWPAEDQLEAGRRVRFLWANLGGELGPIAAWAIIHGGSLDHFARTRRCRRSSASQLLQQALDAIALFYDGRP